MNAVSLQYRWQYMNTDSLQSVVANVFVNLGTPRRARAPVKTQRKL